MGLYTIGKYNYGLLFTNNINNKYSFHWIVNYNYQAWRREALFSLILYFCKGFGMQLWYLQVFLLQLEERRHSADVHNWLCSEIIAQTKGNA